MRIDYQRMSLRYSGGIYVATYRHRDGRVCEAIACTANDALTAVANEVRSWT